MTTRLSPNSSFGIRHPSLKVTAEYIVLATLVAMFIWRGFIPAWNTASSDFQDYYLAARLYRQGHSLEQIYDWSWMQRQKDRAGMEGPIVTFAVLTPFSLLPVLPFSSLPPLLAKRCWLLLNLVLLGLSAYLLRRMSRLSARRLAILIFFATACLWSNFIQGQEYVLLLFLLTAAAWLYFENRGLASGLTLAVGGALKIYPALFLIFFVRKKQWRAAAGIVAGSIAIWLLSLYLFGFETVRTYLVDVLPWPLRAEGQDPYNIQWNSFSGVLHRLFVFEPELNPHPVAHLPVLYAVLQPICQGLIFVPFLWSMGSSRDDAAREKLLWGTFVAMLLLLSTNPASFDFTVLILAATLAVGALMEAGRAREAATVVVLYALVCFPFSHWIPQSPSGSRTLLAVPRLWAMTGLWICLLRLSLPSTSVPLRVRLRSREAVIFASIWLALVVPAAALNLLRQKGEYDNYAARLFVAPDSFLDTDPVLAGERVFFTMMTSRGYLTGVFDGTSLTRLGFGTDSFHPAASPGSSAATVELASTSSQVVQIPSDANAQSHHQFISLAQDAEKPAVSRDGEWLAFIRESKGRGTLWVKQLQPGAKGTGSLASERPLSGSELDVLEAGFAPGDEIIFSGKPRGRPPGLFRTKPGSTYVTEESAPAPRRYPAVSPDGRWLAFSQREGGNWQLWMQDRQTRAERRLTDNDCNSTAPAWYPDSKRLVYATDCARGHGLTALCRITAVP